MEKNMEKKSNHFSGQLGFVLVAAGSAVGVGNLWRFPYLAAKDGGDPEYNASLRLAIERAKGISMPNDNINRAIKKGTGELAGETYEELSFEGYGLAGVAVIVEALTDNKNRTTSAVRSTFDKYGGNLGAPGCVSYMFSRKGIILIEKTDDIDEDTD